MVVYTDWNRLLNERNCSQCLNPSIQTSGRQQHQPTTTPSYTLLNTTQLKLNGISSPLPTTGSTTRSSSNGIHVSKTSLDERNLLDHQGNSPLFWAARYGRVDVVHLLIHQYNLPINRQNFEGESPLSMAVMSGSYETVCTLLESGANVNAANIRSETPLHLGSLFWIRRYL